MKILAQTLIAGTLISTFLTGCGGPKILVPTEADAQRGAASFPGLTLADLHTGKTNVETYCVKCHDAESPREYPPAEWEKIIPKMAAIAKKKTGKVIIDNATQESIRKYFVVMSESK